MNKFDGKLGLQQRILPTYRKPFFDALAQACAGGLSVFAGQPRPVESVKSAETLDHAVYHPATNRHYFSGPFYLCKQQGFIEWLEKWQPDALVVEANPRYPTTPKAIDWMHARGKPVLGWALGAPPLSGPFAGFRQRARRRLLHSLDGVISYSQRGAAEYRNLGIPAEKVFVAYNAAAPKPSAPPPVRSAAIDRKPTLLFVGRLQARKRVDMLLKACAAQTPLPRLLIVGDGPARPEFESLAKEIYPKAKFLGAKFGEELNRYYAQADLFVLPGTGGLAVQQAMSHGLPVIVAQGDGTQDDLVREGNGWLVPPGDQACLTQTLTQALSNPAKLRQMGQESYRITAEEINLETMVGAFVNALKTIRTA